MSHYKPTFVIQHVVTGVGASNTFVASVTPEFFPGDASTAPPFGVRNPDSLFVADSLTLNIDATNLTANTHWTVSYGDSTGVNPFYVQAVGDSASGTTDTVHMTWPNGLPIKLYVGTGPYNSTSQGEVASAFKVIISSSATATGAAGIKVTAVFSGHVEPKSCRAN